MKKECNIVRDLLPNYIENLLNNDTIDFVKNHINNCEECKNTLEIMKKDDLNLKKQDYKKECLELDHLKKYRKKMSIFKIILFIFIIILISIYVIFSIKYNYINTIINNTYSKKQELKDLDNYSIVISEHLINYETAREDYFTTNYYYKDGKYRETKKSESINGNILNSDKSYYGEIDSNKRIEIYDDVKTIINATANYNFLSKGSYINKIFFSLKSDIKDLGFFQNIIIKNGIKVERNRFNGKDCYVLRIEDKVSYREIWINKENNIPIREINEIYGEQYYEKTISFYMDIVKEQDVTIPEYEGYTIKEYEENVNEDVLQYKYWINN